MYITSGSMELTIPDDISESDLVDAVTNTLAESLNVHPSEVFVEIDMETGEVSYTITTENFNDATSTQFDLAKNSTQDEIASAIESTFPSIDVRDVDVSDEIDVNMEFTVDANNAENDVTQAAWQTEQMLSDFEVNVDNTFVTQAPTITPTATNIPSATPSITGNYKKGRFRKRGKFLFNIMKTYRKDRQYPLAKFIDSILYDSK